MSIWEGRDTIRLQSLTKTIKIRRVSESIFTRSYFAHCLHCSFCNDLCCSFGCPVDIAEKERILAYTSELEAQLGIGAPDWFQGDTELRPDYPSGEIVRTRVYRDRCVFYNHILRGCHLHHFAVQKGIDQHLLKPMVCFLFPLTWDGTYLYVSEFLDELPCNGQGVNIFDAQIDELKTYLGNDFVSGLERIASHKTGQD